MATQYLRIQLRRDDKSEWDRIKPDLYEGEMGLELDTGRYKIGRLDTNGDKISWDQLSYSALGISKQGKGIQVYGNHALTENDELKLGEISVKMDDFTTADLPEHDDFKYYTDGRAREAVSLVISPEAPVKGGDISYDQETGVFTFNNTDAYTELEVDTAVNAIQIQIDAINGTDPDTADGSKADLVEGKVPLSQIPSISVMEFKGAVATESDITSVVATVGDFVINLESGTAWVLTEDGGGTGYTDINNWRELKAAGAAVLSVNNITGPAVLLTVADIPGAVSAVDFATSQQTQNITLGGHDGRLTNLEITELPTYATEGDASNDGLFSGDLYYNSTFTKPVMMNAKVLPGIKVVADAVDKEPYYDSTDDKLTVKGVYTVTEVDQALGTKADLAGADFTGEITAPSYKGTVVSTDGTNTVMVDPSTLSFTGKLTAADGTEILNPGSAGGTAMYVGDSTGVHTGSFIGTADSTVTNANITINNGSFVGGLLGDVFGRVYASDNSTLVLIPGDGTAAATFSGNVTKSGDTSTVVVDVANEQFNGKLGGMVTTDGAAIEKTITEIDAFDVAINAISAIPDTATATSEDCALKINEILAALKAMTS